MKKITVLTLLLAILLTACAQAPGHDVVLYLPNETADGYLEKTVRIDGETLQPQAVVDALAKEGALPEGIQVLSLGRTEDMQLVLDLSSAFAGALRATGTSGETMYVGSLVDTFLTAWGAEELTLTCDGALLETGHDIYDAPLSFYGDPPAAAPEQDPAHGGENPS